MTPAENIRGRVHVLNAGAWMALLGDPGKRRKKLGRFMVDIITGKLRRFNIKIFYRQKNTIYHSDEIGENWRGA